MGECTNPNPRIAPGDSRKICIPFEVDEDADLSKFQLALDSGFSEDGGEWALPRSTGTGASSVGSSAVGDEVADGGAAGDPNVNACD